jgi:hypothetical protein
MGGLLYRANTWWGFLKALLVPIFLHAIYDYPILLAHQGLFDKDVLYIYLLLLLYLVPFYPVLFPHLQDSPLQLRLRTLP